MKPGNSSGDQNLKMKKTDFLTAFQNACRLYFQSWRRLALPIFCIGLLSGICLVIDTEIMHHSTSNPLTRFISLVSPLAVIFLLEAGLINCLQQFFRGKENEWKSLLEVFFWKRLTRLLSILMWLCLFFVILWLPLALLALQPEPVLYIDIEKIADLLMLFSVSLQFFVILAALEKSDRRPLRCFLQGLRETISQHWGMWGAWFLAWLVYRIIGRIAWVLAWWIPNQFLGIRVQGSWIFLSFALLLGYFFSLVVFLFLSLREKR